MRETDCHQLVLGPQDVDRVDVVAHVDQHTNPTVGCRIGLVAEEKRFVSPAGVCMVVREAHDSLPRDEKKDVVADGAFVVLLRGGGFETAQRVLRHADPSTTSAMYSQIDAGELAEEASAAFEHVDHSQT